MSLVHSKAFLMPTGTFSVWPVPIFEMSCPNIWEKAIADKYLTIYPKSGQDRMELTVYTVPMYKKAFLKYIKIKLGSAK